MILNKIPQSFKLFGSTIRIKWDNVRMNDINAFGEYDHSTLTISLSDLDGVRNIDEDKILDTFYHEKVHAILSAMREDELNKNEQFVDIFAKLLRQSIETEELCVQTVKNKAYVAATRVEKQE